jgi:hypothetical protein
VTLFQTLRLTLFYPKTKIDNDKHLAQSLRVHSLLSDYELEDVWHFPVTLTSTQSLQLFMDQLAKTNSELVKNGITGFLFRFRLFLGRLFRWDENVLRDKLVPGSIRFRYAQQENLAYENLPDPGSPGFISGFIPVYQMENELLLEIENSTVQAALHLSRVPSGIDTWTIHMAVYVKPKGLFGRLYMALITPFRLWIVYPSLMKAVGRNWAAHIESWRALAET